MTFRPLHLAPLLLLTAVSACNRSPATAPTEAPAALTVVLVQPETRAWPQRVAASGHIAAWQEAIIGSELGGARLDEVRVNVGDRVKAGQLLAHFNEDTLRADLARLDAALAEARANLDKSTTDVERATTLQQKGALSKSELLQVRTQAAVNAARVQSAEAQRDAQLLQLKRARVLAPDDGVISARTATVGAVVSPGTELFRLIRRSRLEWRAEVRADALPQLAPGARALIQRDGGNIIGTLRQVAPAVNPDTLTGIAYVDLPADSGLAAGMFVSGDFELATREALTLPESALVFRDGNRYAMQVDAGQRVHQVKVRTGRRADDRVEVDGVAAGDRYVLDGGAFLNEGDRVDLTGTKPAP